MTKENLKYSVIFRELKKNKKAQQSALRLAKSADWVVIRQFVAQVKNTLLEASFEVDSLKEIRKYKHLIKGMESVVLLPRLVGLVTKVAKESEISKREKELEAKRKKYNPGAFIRSAVDKIKGK